jgi:hypothetical protein
LFRIHEPIERTYGVSQYLRVISFQPGEAVEVEGFGGGGVVAPAFGNMQVAGIFDGRDDGSADSSQVGGAAITASGPQPEQQVKPTIEYSGGARPPAAVTGKAADAADGIGGDHVRSAAGRD